MTRIITIYGLIAGAIVTTLMYLTLPISQNQKYFDFGEVLGYMTMIIALSAIFFGVRTYRDKHLGGSISFGRAFLIGLYIAIFASIVYTVSWEIYLNTVGQNFMDNYTQCYIAKIKSEGATEIEIQKQTEKLNAMKEWYKNPILRWGITFLEIFPVGLVVALISATILRKKQKQIA